MKERLKNRLLTLGLGSCRGHLDNESRQAHVSGHIWGCVFKLIELHLSECGIKEEGHGPQTWHTDTSDHKELFGR